VIAPDADALMLRHLDGATSAAEDAIIAGQLRDDVAARRRFAELTMALVAVRDAVRGAAGQPARGRRQPLRMRWLLAAAAAAAVAVTAAWWWRPEQRPTDGLLADGRVVGRGSLVAATATPVGLDLGGYCRVTLDPGATARLDGAPGAEAITLEQGSVTCDIVAGVGAFTVRSAFGEVRVKGTRFTVSLVPSPEDPMSRRLVVNVLIGAVVLSGVGGDRLVQAGESASSRAATVGTFNPTLPAAGTAIVTRENCDQTVVSVEVPAISVGGPSSHDPQFTSAAFWPQLTGKEYFLKSTWPKGKLLTWAKPGVSAGGRNQPDPLDPANWLLDGKPCTELVFDEDTDVLLPASQTVYVVNFRDLKQIPRQVHRHITVESGANFRGGGDGIGRQIHGNLWVKRGGALSAQGASQWVGNRHTFVRNDNQALLKPWALNWDPTNHDMPKSVSRFMFSQYFAFSKANQASTEFFGQIITLDEFQVTNCPVIVAANSMLLPGRNAEPWVRGGGTIALMDGAFFGAWSNNFGRCDLDVTGNLQAGMPDRPIARSATVNVAFKNSTDAKYTGKESREITRRASLTLNAGSSLRSFTSDAKKARLLIGMSPPDRPTRTITGADGLVTPLVLKPEEITKFDDWFDTLPRGITVYLAKDVAVDGVEFDGLWEGGGLLVQDPNQQSAWRNVFFGSHLKKGAPLTTRIDRIKKEASW